MENLIFLSAGVSGRCRFFLLIYVWTQGHSFLLGLSMVSKVHLLGISMVSFWGNLPGWTCICGQLPFSNTSHLTGFTSFFSSCKISWRDPQRGLSLAIWFLLVLTKLLLKILSREPCIKTTPYRQRQPFFIIIFLRSKNLTSNSGEQIYYT